MKLSEIGKAKENYRDELYQTHNSYTIGVNDGKEFCVAPSRVLCKLFEYCKGALIGAIGWLLASF